MSCYQNAAYSGIRAYFIQARVLIKRDAGMKQELIASGVFSQAACLPEQIEEAINAPLPFLGTAEKVCVCGVGNSGLAGDVITDFANNTASIPVYVVRNIELPGWIESDTVVILLSYSGDTAEIIDSYVSAKSRGCRCIVISSGGKLSEMAEKSGDVLVKINGGLLPRNAFGYLLGHLAAVLERMGVCDAATELRKTVPNIKAQRERLMSPDSDLVQNIANLLFRRIPVIYCLADMRSAASRWKGQINENAKTLAFCGLLPEFSHNEIVGWSDDKNNAAFVPVILYDDDASEMMRQMTDVSMDILEEKRIDLISYHISGDGNMDKNLNCMLLGDFVSCHLAHLYSTGSRRTLPKSGKTKFIVFERTS